MLRHQLEHIIRAACGVADITEVVIVGSQAVLGQFPNAPAELLKSMEADVFPKDDPTKSDVIDGAIGEKSLFDETFGYYAHGVGPDTAIVPSGALDRLVPVCNENTRGLTGWCLEIHDLAVSKLVAGREKDVAFVECLIRNGMVDGNLVTTRLRDTPIQPERMELSEARLARILRQASER
jgi:hypothetical protein